MKYCSQSCVCCVDRELFGKEDKDYRKLPPIPKLVTKAPLPPSSLPPMQSPRSASWGQFKADRPEEFPFQMPTERPRLQRLSGEMEFRTPLLSPPVAREALRPGAYSRPGDPAISPEQENLDIPKPLMLSHSEDIMRQAEEQVQSGKLTQENYQELLKQLRELYRLQKIRMEMHNDREGPAESPVDMEALMMDDEKANIINLPPPVGSPKKVLLSRPKEEPPVKGKRLDVGRGRPLPPDAGHFQDRGPVREAVPSGRGQGRGRGRGGPGKWDADISAEPRPDYDTSKYYVPEYDERWVSRVKEKQGRLPGSHCLVVNKTQFDMIPDMPRSIRLLDASAVVVSDTSEVLLTVGRESKPKCYYKLGEPPKQINLRGKDFRIFVQGPLKRFWIDGHQFEVRADSPPLKIWIARVEHNIRIDSFRKRIYVDGHDLCPFETEEVQKVQIAYKDHEIAFKPPLRQILIDGSLCKLDLGSVFPLVVIKDKPHGIRFNGKPRIMKIDGEEVKVPLDRPRWYKVAGVRPRLLAFGGPGHEVIIDDQWYEAKFGGAEKFVQIGLRTVKIQLEGPPPEVKILGELITPDRAKELAGWPQPERPPPGPPGRGRGPRSSNFEPRGPRGPAPDREQGGRERGPEHPPRLPAPPPVPSLLGS